MNNRIKIFIIFPFLIFTGAIIALAVYMHANTNIAKEKDSIEIKKERLMDMLYNRDGEDIISYFYFEIKDEDILNRAKEEVERIDGVEWARIKTRQETLDEMKKRFSKHPELMETYDGDNNVFPDSLIIRIKNDYFNKIEEIDEKILNVEINGKKVFEESRKRQLYFKSMEDLDGFSEVEIDALLKLYSEK